MRSVFFYLLLNIIAHTMNNSTIVTSTYATDVIANYSNAVTSNYSARITSQYSTVVTQNYSSALTNSSPVFNPYDLYGSHYYEAIQVTVSVSGNYSLASKSGIDTYGYLYVNNFNPLKPCNNLIGENDDGSTDLEQFQIIYAFQPSITYVLVVTTWDEGITGAFWIVSSVSARVTLLRISSMATLSSTIMPTTISE
jgi:hypothetical protein